MSNDMTDKIYLWLKELQWSSEFPISHKIIADHIAGHVQQLIKEAFITGYEKGHNDTVESQYCDAEEVFEDFKDEILNAGGE